MTPEQEQEILSLRVRNLTAKQIARKLGLKVSDVSQLIKTDAEQTTTERESKGELAPVAQCLINYNCAKRLLEGISEDSSEVARDEAGGLGLVTVARSTGYDRFIVCTYLIDYWCLGLKDTIEPRKFNGVKYKKFIAASYMGFAEGYQEISLEQAQTIVYGAINYGAEFGFKPHRDFEKTKAHLGDWHGQPQLKFGYKGKPFYVSGPYDDAYKILKTLREKVGEGNFKYLIGAE